MGYWQEFAYFGEEEQVLSECPIAVAPRALTPDGTVHLSDTERVTDRDMRRMVFHGANISDVATRQNTTMDSLGRKARLHAALGSIGQSHAHFFS